MTFKFLWQPTGELQIAAGLRIILLFAIPLLISQNIFHNNLGIYVAMGGYPLILADVAIFYHTRFQSMIAITLIGGFSVFIGTLVAKFVWLKIIFTFLWLFGAGYLSVYGHLGVMIGTVVSLFYLFALDLPPADFNTAILRTAVVVAGAIWAMILCLAFWPINPYQPLRDSAANCYRAIANYIQDFRQNYFLEDVNSQETEKAFLLKQTIQKARDSLSFNRRTRLGRSQMGELTSILLEEAECLITQILSLVDLVTIHHNFPQFITINLLIYQVLEQIYLINKKIPRLIFKKPTNISLDQLIHLNQAIEQQRQLQQYLNTPESEYYSGYVAIERLNKILEKIIKKYNNIIEITQDFDTYNLKKTNLNSFYQILETEADEMSWFQQIRDNFTLKSSLFRHSLRLGIITALGLLVQTIFNISEGFWISLTIVLVLQPDFGKTFERFFHRVLGTILGALFTPVLLTFIQIQHLIQVIAIVSISLAITLLKFHYATAVFFMSVFVINIQSLVPESSYWNIASIRLSCTLIGCGLAFIGSLVLFRENQQKNLSVFLAQTVESSRNYFTSVMQVYLGQSTSNSTLINRYKQAGRLSYFNAQSALQSVVSDPNTKPQEIEPAITLMSYLNRFNRTITVLRVQLEHLEQVYPSVELENFTSQVEDLLTDLSRSLQEKNLPRQFPNLDLSLVKIEQRLDIWQGLLTSRANTQIIKDYTLIKTELETITERLQAMYSAVVRINT